MSTFDPNRKAPIELVRPSFYGMLICYYAGTFGYGVTAYLFGVLSLVYSNGHAFSVLWGLLLAVASLISGGGVLVALRWRNHLLELFGTVTILALMVGYTVSIFLGALNPHHGDITRLSAFWLPVIIAILPAWRISVMATDGSLGRRKRAR